MSMQFLDFDVPASGAQVERSAAGDFIRYSIITVGVTGPRIRVKTDTHDDLVMKPGDKVRTGKRFSRLMVSAYDGLQVTGFLQVGEGSFDSDSVVGNVTVDGTVSVAGTVTTADNGRVDSLAGRAFSTAVLTGLTAAEFSHAQIFNPAASGKRVLVNSISATVQTDGAFSYGFYHTELTTLVSAALNKLVAGAAGVALIKHATNAAQLWIARMAYVRCIAKEQVRVEFERPIVLLEGKGLVVNNGTVNDQLIVTFEHTEEAL